jgi:sulfotransferase
MNTNAQTTPTFHFISGLPRSGSTLLSAILQQNPLMHADMSSPVSSLINNMMEQIGAGSEFYSLFDEEKRKRMYVSVFDAYYQDIAQQNSLIFDTNRMWTVRLHQLVELFGDFKVICLVRNPAWIMDSFEQIYRKNPFSYSKMFAAGNRQTVYSCCESMVSGGIVGAALTALKEAYYGNHSERLLLIDYDLLAKYPHKTLTLLYEWLCSH